MKSCLFGICITLFASGSAIAGTVHAQNVGFAAPAIIGTSNVYNPEVGAIVFDQSTSSFYGYNNSGIWIVLGGGTTTPPGVIEGYAGAVPPSGYLLCDGNAISRTTYSALFAAIGTIYGSGDGSTTFNIPNAQGVFLRGAGTQIIPDGMGNNITYFASQGTTQGDLMQGHNHGLGFDVLGQVTNGTGTASYSTAGSNATSFSQSLGPITDGSNGLPRTGIETRPANITVRYIIKY